MKGVTNGNPEVLIKRSEQARSQLCRYARALCYELGLDPNLAIVEGPVKTLKRVFEKAANKYNGDISQVPDLCRLRILFDDPKQIETFRKIFGPGKNSHPFHERMEKKNYYLASKENPEIDDIEDFFEWPKAHGYVGINLNVVIYLNKYPEPIPCEIQIQHKNMQDTYEASRVLYKKMRPLTDKLDGGLELGPDETEKLESLRKENIELFRKALIDLDLLDLVNPRSTVFTKVEKPQTFVFTETFAPAFS